MISKNKTVNKAHEIIKNRVEKLRIKKLNLHDEIYEKYPEALYGVKAMTIFERKATEINDELRLLQRYVSGIYDLIEIIEGEVNK